MKSLERDALEVLGLVRSLQNSIAPINRIPPVVLSLIPEYFHENDMDQGLLTLTHVCRGWREIFTSRSSLWTKLNFTSVDRTRAYIQRSKSSPLKIHIEYGQDPPFLDNAFSLVIPHLHRLKSLVVSTRVRSDFFKHFYYHAPLLEELDIFDVDSQGLVFSNKFFNGDLSSLRKLSLGGVITHLPWKNLTNLKYLSISSSTPAYNMTQLLDLFEHTPQIHTVVLGNSIPSSSGAPPERIIPLRHLKTLRISANPAHSIVLNHLSIPTGASLRQSFCYRGKKSPLLYHLPETLSNLKNLSNITALNLRFNSRLKLLKVAGPSGGLRIGAYWLDGAIDTYNMDRWILHSLGLFPLSTIQRLSFSEYDHPGPDGIDECPIFRTLSSTNNIQTLVLIKCNNQRPFILALDPAENPTELLLCPNLENFVLYIESLDQFRTDYLIDMAENRASRGAKLSSITIVGLNELALGKEVLKLKEHVTNVEYRVDDESPAWDDNGYGSE